MLKYINYYWRIIATGFAFSIFGLGGLLLTLTLFPLLTILPIKKTTKIQKARLIIHWSFRFFIGLLQFLGIMKLSIIHPTRLQHTDHHLIIANHPTLIDVVILISLLPRANCIIKKALWYNPFLHGVVVAAGYIFNQADDPQDLINACTTSLKSQQALIIFPEGTRTIPNQPMKWQRGAANIALQSKANIIPIHMNCVPSTLTKDKKWYEVPFDRAFHITVQIGETLEIMPFIEHNTQLPIAARKLTNHLYQTLQGSNP